MAWITIGLITAVNGLVGYAVAKFFFGYGDRPFQGLRSEWLMLIWGSGTLLNGWLALVLAELGRFSWPLWLALTTAGACAALLLLRRRAVRFEWGAHPLPVPGVTWTLPAWVETVFLAGWLCAAAFLFFRPHQYLWGGADAGVYVNLAAHVVDTGGLIIHDEILAALDEALYPAFLRVMDNLGRQTYFWSSGFTVEDFSGRISPPFYHLAPVWQALAYAWSGAEGALRMTGYWMVWASAAVYLVLRRLLPPNQWWIALAGLAALSICALQVWFARYPTTEALTQFLFWLGLWAFIRWGDDAYQGARWGAVAGGAWGSAFLVRIDAFFVGVIPLFLLAYLLHQRRFSRAQLPFFAAMVLLPLHATLHSFLFSRFYFFSIYGYMFQVIGSNWAALLMLAVVAALVAALLWRRRDWFVAWFGHTAVIWKSGVITIIALFFFYNWFIRPIYGAPYTYINPWDNIPVEAWNHENLIRLGWYLSPLGIWLGAAGILCAVWEGQRRVWAFLLLGLVFTFLYVANIRSNAIQIYAMRRYVPVVVPFFISSAALFLSWLDRQDRLPRWRSWVAVGITAVWLASVGWSARGFISQVDMQNFQHEIKAVNDQLPPRSILLFNQSVPIGIGDHVGAPLRLMYGHHVFVLYHIEQLDVVKFSRAIADWQAQGYAVYWMAIPGQHPWPLATVPLERAFSFAIPVSYLEGTYTHKPTAIMHSVWPAEALLVGRIPQQ